MMKYYKFKKVLFIKICVLVFSFLIPVLAITQNDYTYKVPEKLNDGWKVSSLKSEGLDSEKIINITNRIKNGEFGNIYSLIIVKNGQLVYEEYFRSSDRDHLFTLYSVSKSFTSALVGIALDKNFIKSINEPFMPYLPEYSDIIEDERKNSITLKHLLTLSSGLDWDEQTYSYEDNRNVHVQMEHTGDWIKFILQRPLSDMPGKKWLYNTGNVQLLSAVIKKSTGLSAHKFAEKYLFKPLGIKKYYWNADPAGYTCAGGSDGGLRLRTRDLAKFGYLYLYEGKWKDRKILSQQWIEESTKKHRDINKNVAYGYLWWVRKPETESNLPGSFYASGSGNHMLIIVPSRKMVIAFNCGGADLGVPIRTIIRAAVL